MTSYYSIIGKQVSESLEREMERYIETYWAFFCLPDKPSPNTCVQKDGGQKR